MNRQLQLESKVQEYDELLANAKEKEKKINDEMEVAKVLKDNHLTAIVNIKGKETLILGEKAKPSISQVISKSKDIQIKNVIEAAKISKEVMD